MNRHPRKGIFTHFEKYLLPVIKQTSCFFESQNLRAGMRNKKKKNSRRIEKQLRRNPAGDHMFLCVCCDCRLREAALRKNTARIPRTVARIASEDCFLAVVRGTLFTPDFEPSRWTADTKTQQTVYPSNPSSE